jgi:cytochrome c oxidase accessory protein FixG
MDIEEYHSSVEADGKRRWLYPLVRKDQFYKYRSWLSYVYFLLFFSAPFIKINGNQFLLFNVIERKFILFGQIFWPQDFFIFVLAMLTGLVCVVLFTIVFGRIFCGWICPQTIFLEMLFRKIEIWIEGEPKARKKLDDGPLTQQKLFKKVAKHSLYLLLSFLIANTFLAYIIGSDELLKIINEPISQHLIGFLGICIFTVVFYLVFSQMRELVCIVACPYGRLQSVMLDKNSLVIAYNYVRGEPRGRLNKAKQTSETKLGDCVDCNLCVAVCPTGIDIRKGTQIECVNCTACIDACDQVMDKINKPRKLIGYYSEEMIKTGTKPKFTSKMAAYSFIMAVLICTLLFFVLKRSNVDVTVLRAGGMLYQEQKDGYISNLYNAELLNKTNSKVEIDLKPVDENIKIKWIQPVTSIQKETSTKATFFVLVPQSLIKETKTSIKINIIQNGKISGTIKTSFLGPVN